MEKQFLEDLIKNYRINQLRHINKRMGRKLNKDGDSHSIWFDLVKLKQLINEIENKAEKHNIKKNDLGIRFYLGAYPDKSQWHKYSDLIDIEDIETKVNKTTILLIPTKKIDKIDIDFDVSNGNGYKFTWI